MDISEAKALTEKRSRKRRVGRGTGSGRGKTSGRGHNGAKSRSGWSSRNRWGGQIPLWRRFPKYGFSNAPFRRDYTVVNVGRLNGFEDGARVSPEVLQDRGIVKQPERGGVKILGDGELEKSLTVRAHAFSDSARQKIEAAGGTVEEIPRPKKPVRNKMKSAAETPEVL